LVLFLQKKNGLLSLVIATLFTMGEHINEPRTEPATVKCVEEVVDRVRERLLGAISDKDIEVVLRVLEHVCNSIFDEAENAG
jgi:hypothetical protein